MKQLNHETMKAIIIEDSRLARLELRTLLKEHPEVNIIGEATNANDGRKLIESLQPDLVFLDIQMPGKNAFDMLEELDEVPNIIFTTAFNEYAVKSFEYNAFDYLLKPIKEKRLAMAIQKAQERLLTPIAPLDYLTENSQVFVKDGEQCWLVKLADVRLFEVYGNYTRIYFEKHRPLILKSLNYLESRLDPQTFFRANRQQIVNLRWVTQLVPWFGGKLKIELRNGETIEVSRRQAVKLKEILSF